MFTDVPIGMYTKTCTPEETQKCPQKMLGSKQKVMLLSGAPLDAVCVKECK